MRKRLLYYSWMLTGLSLVSAVASVYLFTDVDFSFTGILLILVVLTVIMLLLAILLSSLFTKRLVKPINQIDLSKPEKHVVFEELAPLLSRMKHQNDIISKQMHEINRRQIEFATITDNMREGLMVMDNEAYVLTCNKSALGLLQTKPTRSFRQNALAFNRSDVFTMTIEKAVSGAPAEGILKIGDRSIHLIANPVKDSSKDPADAPPQGVILFLLDVTEKEDREKLRREFTANVSHELKTPLTSISGYAEIIVNGVAKNEDVPRFATNIYNEAQRLITLIGDIMTLSRLDDQGAALNDEPVNLYNLTEGVVRRLNDAALKKNIHVTLTGVSAETHGAPQILDEAVFNIIDNAIKYNRDGGSVDITVTIEAGMAVLTVKDTGVGIPRNEHARVFERFYRLDKSRNSSIEGTGLGLSIVKHGVQIHGGSISLDSDGHSGSTLTVRLPALHSIM